MYKKGTVVLVPFPFTDLSGNKVRPALIVSDGKVGSDVVVVFITSQTKSKGQYLVTLKPSEENGLKIPSQVVCAKLATLDTKIILGELGALATSDLTLVDNKIRKILKLS
jgi:mRNA interferase MazF